MPKKEKLTTKQVKGRIIICSLELINLRPNAPQKDIKLPIAARCFVAFKNYNPSIIYLVETRWPLD